MARNILSYAVGMVFICALPLRAAEGPDVQIHPLKYGTFTSFGLLNGSPVESYGAGGPVEEQPFTRIGLWFTQPTTINQRLEITIGLGGLYWYPFPKTEGLPHTRLASFGLDAEQASAVYKFGDLEDPFLKLHAGFFRHKYNPDSKNLGEYLLRCGTYPGDIVTWDLNRWPFGARGLRAEFSFLESALKVDAMLYIEGGTDPNFNLSPGLMASYTVANFIEIGGGVVFSHLIDVNPDETTPKIRANAYFDDSKMDPAVYWDSIRGVELPLPINEHTKPGLEFSNPLVISVDDTARVVFDPRTGTYTGRSFASVNPALVDSSELAYMRGITEELGLPAQYLTPEANGIPKSQLEYYTFKGQKIMGRISVRPQRILNLDILGPDDLTLYGEIALLGVKNYPFYYEKRSERMPLMFGFNFPTFHLLDFLTIECEYLKTQFPNDTFFKLNRPFPIWRYDETGNITPQQWVDSNLAVTDDINLFWSISAKKTISTNFSLSFRIARDHFRTTNYFGSPSYKPIMQSNNDWWCAMSADWAI